MSSSREEEESDAVREREGGEGGRQGQRKGEEGKGTDDVDVDVVAAGKELLSPRALLAGAPPRPPLPPGPRRARSPPPVCVCDIFIRVEMVREREERRKRGRKREGNAFPHRSLLTVKLSLEMMPAAAFSFVRSEPEEGRGWSCSLTAASGASWGAMVARTFCFFLVFERELIDDDRRDGKRRSESSNHDGAASASFALATLEKKKGRDVESSAGGQKASAVYEFWDSLPVMAKSSLKRRHHPSQKDEQRGGRPRSSSSGEGEREKRETERRQIKSTSEPTSKQRSTSKRFLSLSSNPLFTFTEFISDVTSIASYLSR